MVNHLLIYRSITMYNKQLRRYQIAGEIILGVAVVAVAFTAACKFVDWVTE